MICSVLPLLFQTILYIIYYGCRGINYCPRFNAKIMYGGISDMERNITRELLNDFEKICLRTKKARQLLKSICVICTAL